MCIWRLEFERNCCLTGNYAALFSERSRCKQLDGIWLTWRNWIHMSFDRVMLERTCEKFGEVRVEHLLRTPEKSWPDREVWVQKIIGAGVHQMIPKYIRSESIAEFIWDDQRRNWQPNLADLWTCNQVRIRPAKARMISAWCQVSCVFKVFGHGYRCLANTLGHRRTKRDAPL